MFVSDIFYSFQILIEGYDCDSKDTKQWVLDARKVTDCPKFEAPPPYKPIYGQVITKQKGVHVDILRCKVTKTV